MWDTEIWVVDEYPVSFGKVVAALIILVFGLIFELYFWVVVRMVLEKKQIESQVRFEIDSVFSQEGIVIAFPQRDIHFDTDTPLRIQWTGSKTSGETNAETSS